MSSNPIYHTAEDRTPYTYLIGWSTHNKWYYGARYGKNCHPSDLWVKYFTSSNYVKKFRADFGEPDIIQIRKTFSTVEQCCLWEESVLRKLDCPSNSSWLNASRYIGLGKWIISEKTRDNMSIAKQGCTPWNKGLTKDISVPLMKISESLTGRVGHHASENQKIAVSKAWKGVKRGPQSEEHKKKIVEARRVNGTLNHSKETKAKMSKTRSSMIRIRNENSTEEKFIQLTEFSFYETAGWVRGRKKTDARIT